MFDREANPGIGNTRRSMGGRDRERGKNDKREYWVEREVRLGRRQHQISGRRVHLEDREIGKRKSKEERREG